MIAFLLSPIGRYLAIAVAALAIVGGAYTKGRIDGRSSYKAKIERQIQDAKNKGDSAREKALRDFDAHADDELPNDGFQRP